MKCKYEGFGVWEGRCVGTTEVDPCIGYEKCSRFRGDYQSNADYIRAMSDEELARFLDDTQYREWEEIQENRQELVDFRSWVEGWTEWLKQPYKEAPNDPT